MGCCQSDWFWRAPKVRLLNSGLQELALDYRHALTPDAMNSALVILNQYI